MAAEIETKLVRFQLVPKESSIQVLVFAEGLLSAFGHDPIVVAKSFGGEALFVPSTFEQASVTATVNTDSLAVTNVKDKDRAEIERTMRDDVLEVNRYPEVRFTSNNVSATRLGEGRYRVRVIGDLTLHGVTQRNVWLSVEMTLAEDTMRVQGEVSIKQTDFNIKLVSVAGGMLKVKNEVKCHFEVVARKAAA